MRSHTTHRNQSHLRPLQPGFELRSSFLPSSTSITSHDNSNHNHPRTEDIPSCLQFTPTSNALLAVFSKRFHFAKKSVLGGIRSPLGATNPVSTIRITTAKTTTVFEQL
ncbi:hypothetical protein VTL71DRAFT_10539 [Oculimacula yallundae]|uniref:Uncharacterized protein n=1 Tax=Oculimacula yallundae TaxID=86028 RepID=A0ABR4CTE6_9HELO